MELPDDILAIIREYSRPCFKYFREYNRIMVQSGIVRWPLLKKKLNDNILAYLLAYENALIELEKERNPDLYKERRRERTRTLNELVVRLVL